ncbi:MAG: SdiA-regulated domain-containing protein [Bacteroidota bacterium]
MKQLIPFLSFCLLFSISVMAQTDRLGDYDWEQPDKQFEMDERLVEISGLSMAEGGTYLAAIQDEEGELFLLDPNSGRIVQQIPFWKEGDYEGVEQVGAITYVVKSSGTIYEIEAAGTTEQSVTKYNGFLNSDNDIEGLGYWPQRHQLLLACKAQPGENLDENRKKAIYAFDLTSKTFIQEPLLVSQRDSVENYLRTCPQGPNYAKICDIFAMDKERFDFNPAALAVHPITGDFYVTSSKGNLLVVLSSIGGIRQIIKLPKRLHRQPEGLCFDSSGNLYIANEAKKDNPAAIYFYSYRADHAAGR